MTMGSSVQKGLVRINFFSQRVMKHVELIAKNVKGQVSNFDQAMNQRHDSNSTELNFGCQGFAQKIRSPLIPGGRDQPWLIVIERTRSCLDGASYFYRIKLVNCQLLLKVVKFSMQKMKELCKKILSTCINPETHGKDSINWEVIVEWFL